MKTILVIEDYTANRDLMRELLEHSNYRVIEAADGQAALEEISRTKPDLVLADIQMPVLDGYGFIQRVRNDPHLKSIRVIALTAYAMAGDQEKIMASGFDGYVTKPIKFSEMLKQIRECLDMPAAGE